MSSPLSRRISLNDLRRARDGGGSKIAMLTCYDFTTAHLMQQAGVPALLVGDSAGNVILGHPTTLPVPLPFMIEIAAAVRRGAPLAFVVADMPFGSYHGSVLRGVKNVVRMVQRTGCDCVKLEVTPAQLDLVSELAGAGIAVMAHVGLRPQSVGLVGGYRTQGRTAEEARNLLALSLQMQRAGAAALLIEAVPSEVAKVVVDATNIPVIGCGAGSACHGHVFVTHDAVALTSSAPRFAPKLGDLATPAVAAFSDYVRQVGAGEYPAPEHQYGMHPDELAKFLHEGEPARL
jgi:3-methyl-2-oxobutanoate hydroxymethyltransferase